MNLSSIVNSDRTDILNRIAAIIFFAWVAVMFTTPVGEGDFFWHVKTGEWIWQHKSLPVSDPFSFTVKDFNPFNPESKRIPFLLKQYWLGQLAFFGIWKAAGEAGMVLFRSLCYTGILLFLYGWGRRLAGSSFWPLCGVILAGKVLQNYSNERPQLFALICMPLLLFLLEKLRTGNDSKPPLWVSISFPLVMLFWSNCHGSYILGIVVILLYAAGHVALALKGSIGLNRFSLSLMAAAVLASGLNPNGFGAFREFFSLSKNYTNLVVEFTSPIVLTFRYGAIDWYYWLFLLAALASLTIWIKRVPLAQILTISALMALSLNGTRYIPFFIMTAPFVCGGLPRWSPRKYLQLLPLLAVLLITATADYHNTLKFRAERAFPAEASRFLREVSPKGNMFNYIGWGGYLMCYTDYPVFIDGRTLIEELLPVHNSILAGAGWQNTLENYKINFMVIPGTDAISLQAYPLLLQLLGDDRWCLIYQDEVTLILIRNAAENSSIIKRYAMDKSIISSHIQARWKWQMKNDF